MIILIRLVNSRATLLTLVIVRAYAELIQGAGLLLFFFNHIVLIYMPCVCHSLLFSSVTVLKALSKPSDSLVCLFQSKQI